MTDFEFWSLRALHAQLQMQRTLNQACGVAHNDSAHRVEMELEHALIHARIDERDMTHG